jgi:hypothetical protein
MREYFDVFFAACGELLQRHLVNSLEKQKPTAVFGPGDVHPTSLHIRRFTEERKRNRNRQEIP